MRRLRSTEAPLWDAQATTEAQATDAQATTEAQDTARMSDAHTVTVLNYSSEFRFQSEINLVCDLTQGAAKPHCGQSGAPSRRG